MQQHSRLCFKRPQPCASQTRISLRAPSSFPVSRHRLAVAYCLHSLSGHGTSSQAPLSATNNSDGNSDSNSNSSHTAVSAGSSRARPSSSSMVLTSHHYERQDGPPVAESASALPHTITRPAVLYDSDSGDADEGRSLTAASSSSSASGTSASAAVHPGNNSTQQQQQRTVSRVLLPKSHDRTPPKDKIPPDFMPPTACDVGFPYKPTFQLDDGSTLHADRIADLLEPLMPAGRRAKIEGVVSRRSYSILPILEGTYDMGNLAAICRSADAMGLGGVHCIGKRSDGYKRSRRTSKGAEKWLDVKLWDDTPACMAAVKAAGYQLVVTHLGPTSVPIQDVDWCRPTAVMLGNEQGGVSPEALAAADVCAIIPMQGFVESFNISVAAALIMWEAQQQRVRRMGKHADLTAEERSALVAVHMMRCVRESRSVLADLITRPPPQWQQSHFRRWSEDMQNST